MTKRIGDKFIKANQAQRRAAEAVLKELWESAYAKGRVEINYPDSIAGAEVLAQRLHESLANFRAKVKRRPLAHLELLAKIQAVSLLKPDDRTVVLEFNPEKPSDTAGHVLALRDAHACYVKVGERTQENPEKE